MKVSLIIPARRSAHCLRDTVLAAHRYLGERYPGAASLAGGPVLPDFEIILVPTLLPGETDDGSVALARELAELLEGVSCRVHPGPSGKGAALRTGYAAARGEWIFFTDADLPYDLEFFDSAAEALRQGHDLVFGNRRLPDSRFFIPIQVLALAYTRHRFGTAFNRVVRALFPIRTTDTQAGIKALSRRLADDAFARIVCPGFFFDLEIFLTALSRGYSMVEFPVRLTLRSEVSTVRVAREAMLALYWLTRILLRHGRRRYA